MAKDYAGMTFNPDRYIIAEAGTGHCEHPTHRLVKIAKDAGADAIKFQIFVPDESLFCPVEGDDRRWERWRKSLRPFEVWKATKDHAEEMGINFLASVFQPTGVEWLNRLGVKAYKVASRAAKTYPYDSAPGHFIISDGFGDAPSYSLREEVEVFVLQCVSKYPVPLWGAAFDDNMGYDGLSDHSGTPWPAMDALARGAKIIEVHFGDKTGPDAPVNLTPDELKLICDFRDALKEMRDG